MMSPNERAKELYAMAKLKAPAKHFRAAHRCGYVDAAGKLDQEKLRAAIASGAVWQHRGVGAVTIAHWCELLADAEETARKDA
jgi:hypothetical protein